MMIFCRRQILFLLVVLIKLTESNRKSKRLKALKRLETYEIHTSDTLPSDLQVTTYLTKGEQKIFYYWSTTNNSSLSATIVTCSSPVEWFMGLSRNENNTRDNSTPEATVTKDITTKYVAPLKGLYVLELNAKESDTYVHIYVSTENGGPLFLQFTRFQNLRLIKKQRRKRLIAIWGPSLVDPQGTTYCLVVHDKKSYKSLCAAQVDKFGTVPPNSTKPPNAAAQTILNWHPISEKDSNDDSSLPMIVCVGRRTQHTLTNLKPGKTYHVNIFATNKQNNFTYPFGSAAIKFDYRVKSIPLKDGKSAFANLKKLDGKAVFRFKVGKNRRNPLNIFIIPCGAVVSVEVFLNGKVVVAHRSIKKIHRVVVDSPVQEGRYYIKIFATNKEDLSKSSGVEVFASSKSFFQIPLPMMPSETIVQEYESLRTCDSVTIGWLPSSGETIGHYCIVVKEGKVRDIDDYGVINQCGLEHRLRKSVDFVDSYCNDVSNRTGQALTEKIKYLKPGKSYVVQVTVKKPKGKSLSYDLLQVHTKPSCHNY